MIITPTELLRQRVTSYLQAAVPTTVGVGAFPVSVRAAIKLELTDAGWLVDDSERGDWLIRPRPDGWRSAQASGRAE